MTDHLQDVPLDASLFRGVVEVEHTPRGVQPHRLPAWARRQLPDPQLLMAQAQPSGVRLVFRTAATTIEVEAFPTRVAYVGAPPRPLGVYELIVDGVPTARGSVDGGVVLTIDMTTGGRDVSAGEPGTLTFGGLPGTDKTVELWLPHNEMTELVALRADAPVSAVPAGDRPVWLHHGSSISHGSNALTPTGTWPAIASAAAGVDLINLGFSGSALLDPATARTMRDLRADVISVKIGINLVNADLMRLRGFTAAMHGFLDTIRDGHPDTPLLLISPILCPIHEDTPGPGRPDPATLGTDAVKFMAVGDPADVAWGKLTLRVIREQMRQIVEARRQDDPNLHYLDGSELYGEDDAVVHPLPDALHPDAETHVLMGERFAKLALIPGGLLARRG
ncbi:SGNH/GDSL hydrolase family protein [Aeromicrobium duanguangcaii]|uniref:GDSL-type esterase/lipase family protein n=1 Tax=Aeromicrobium duanguangcaii TaxID=2968086 RepID=A0ABY5KJ23_9ACTN|nr:SGNH/GDSL hydrolase family protein [Aeromicrobium duanguangcaii]MCD9153039.1 GDSL-type esterase/lipase family protein [Aeromicrobium duanguangcaii]UUI69855.1 GDSL-type esterase/lipase family protein [Aeromicrobium duanguangcaii]